MVNFNWIIILQIVYRLNLTLITHYAIQWDYMIARWKIVNFVKFHIRKKVVRIYASIFYNEIMVSNFVSVFHLYNILFKIWNLTPKFMNYTLRQFLRFRLDPHLYCQAHAKHGTIQYSLMHFYRNIYTINARHMPVTIKAKDILQGTWRAWLCELATFQSCARPRVLCMIGHYNEKG